MKWKTVKTVLLSAIGGAIVWWILLANSALDSLKLPLQTPDKKAMWLHNAQAV